MKRLISAISILTIVPLYSSGMNSLKELATQEFVKQIFDYPSLTAEGKLKFNNQPQPGEALSFKGQNLDFLSVPGIKLKGANFEGVTLNGTNFFKADLTGCSFKGATLKNVNFQEATLTNADFRGVHFKNTKFQGAKLTETLTLPYYCETVEILKLYSDLQNEEDKQVLNNLIGTGVFDFKNQTIQGLNLRKINFKNCNFSRNKIINCDLTDAQLGDALVPASFSDVKLSDDFILNDKRDLTSLYNDSTLPQDHKNILAKILLTQVNLSGAILFEDFIIPSYKDHKDLVKRYSDFPEERENLNKLFDIISLDLSHADLKNLDLQGINLSKANLEHAQFQGSILFEGFKVPEYHSDLDLVKRYSDFPEERESLNRLFSIISLYLMYADLKNLNLQGLDFTKTNLEGAQLQGAVFSDDFKIPEYSHNPPLYHRDNEPDNLVEIYGKSTDPILRKNINKLFDILPIKIRDIYSGGVNFRGLNLVGLNLKNITFGMRLNFSGAILFEGFTVPEYKNGIDLVRMYSKSTDPKFRRNLNRLFSICPLKLSRCGVHDRGDHEYDTTEYRTVIVDLKNLDLEGINLINSRCNDVDFLGCNLTDSMYDEDDYSSLKSTKLDGVQWSEDFVFPSNLSNFSNLSRDPIKDKIKDAFDQFAKKELSKNFVFPNLEIISEKDKIDEIKRAYVQIAKTERQKYFFRQACKLIHPYIYKNIDF